MNHTTVHSSDSGVTWSTLPEFGGWVGPGMPYPSGAPGTLFTGGGPEDANQTGNSTAHGTAYAAITATQDPGGAWSVSRVIREGNLTWRLPRRDVCLMSGYSGRILRVGSSEAPLLLKTWVLRTNCSAPPRGQGWGVLPLDSIHLFSSSPADARAPGLEWQWRSQVVSAAAVVAAVDSTEGANENDVALLPDGRLLCVFRVDGGDGWPTHGHKPFMAAYSSDLGLTWSSPEALSPPVLGPGFVGSARPMLLSVPGGPLLLSGGRPFLNLWVSADGHGRAWRAVNLAAEHNQRVGAGQRRFCDAFANGTSLQPNGTFWLESTCYTSLVEVTPAHGGRWAALVCYDDLGTEAPSAPPECQHLTAGVHTYCMRIEGA